MQYKAQMSAAEFREFLVANPGVMNKSKGRGVKDIAPKTSANQGSVKAWYTVGDKRYYFRSTYEINYALILQFYKEQKLILDWNYEAKEFWFKGVPGLKDIQRGVCSYKVDFGVVQLDGSTHWHEVKGYMDPKSKTKLARMERFYPGEVVKLIDKTTLNILKKTIPLKWVTKEQFVAEN